MMPGVHQAVTPGSACSWQHLAYFSHLRPQTATVFCDPKVPAKEEAALLAGLAMAAAGTAQCGGSEEAQRCSVCRAALPSRHLLDLHLEEVHDSFFAAQVARKLKVGWVPAVRLHVPPVPVSVSPAARRCTTAVV